MKRTVLFVLIVIVVAGGGYGIGQRQQSPAPPIPATQSAQSIYVCPMHAHITQVHSGACPICGMSLVAANSASDHTTQQIHVNTATQAKLGVRLASVEHATISQEIATYATLVADENAVQRITPNVNGLLTALHVHRIGQRIQRGQLLFEMSSQDALNLQYEFIDIQRRGAPTRKMVEERRVQNEKILSEASTQDAAQREQAERTVLQSKEQLWSILQPLQRDSDRVSLRLKQIGFTEAMLSKLAQDEQALSSVPVRAQRDCVVQEVMARPGMDIERMTEVLRCVDTNHPWLELVLYPNQLAWVREGDATRVTFDDGTVINTTLSGLSSFADGAARTVRARIAIKLGRAPILGEYVTVIIQGLPRRVLSVPKSAVMRSGRGNSVMRAMDEGHFMPVSVVTGIENTERVAILDGLTEGDQVVVNGQFLLDAAASIADSIQRQKPSN